MQPPRIFDNGNGTLRFVSLDQSKEVTVTYRNGEPLEGTETSWYLNGQREMNSIYKDGKAICFQMWNEQGILVYEE